MPPDERPTFIDGVRRVVNDHGFDPDFYVVEDEAGNSDHYFYTKDKSDAKDLIYVEHGFSKPSIREISEVSAAVRGLQEGYSLHRICFPSELKNEIGQLYHNN
jgi:hypothetical protein